MNPRKWAVSVFRKYLLLINILCGANTLSGYYTKFIKLISPYLHRLAICTTCVAKDHHQRRIDSTDGVTIRETRDEIQKFQEQKLGNSSFNYPFSKGMKTYCTSDTTI